MLQRWTAETHMRRWNFNAADPDSNLLLNRDVSRWNRDVSPFQLQFCDCGKTLQKFKHKSTKNMSEPRQKMPSSTLPKKIHRTEIRKYPPANPPKNLENNPPKTKFLISDYIQKNNPDIRGISTISPENAAQLRRNRAKSLLFVRGARSSPSRSSEDMILEMGPTGDWFN